jgi:hypothetical protein
MVYGNEHLNPPGDRNGIAAQDVHPYTLFEQGSSRSPIRCVELGKPLVDCACSAVEIAAPGFLGNSCKDGVDKVSLICAPSPLAITSRATFTARSSSLTA